MNNHRGIFDVLLLLVLISLIYWAAVYNILHQPDIPVEPGIFSQKEPELRVQIINSPDTLELIMLSDWFVFAGKNQPQMNLARGTHVAIECANGKLILRSTTFSGNWLVDSLRLFGAEVDGELQIKNVPYGAGWWWAGKEDRNYSGEIKLYPFETGSVQVIVKLPLEKYLRGVVPYEIDGDSPLEALKAQAIAARSEAVMALRSTFYSGRRFDLTADVECQVFGGNKKRTIVSDSAIAYTRGLVLFSEDNPIHAYYSSNCGGHSETIANVWPERAQPAPYMSGHFDSRERIPIKLHGEKMIARWLASNPDVYCNPSYYKDLPAWNSKSFRWRRSFSVAELTELISHKKNIGRFETVKVLRRGVSGRIISLAFIGRQDSLVVRSELAIRQISQPPLRSACFIVQQGDGFFEFAGAGWGHGVGMCQSGALTQANLGISYEKILQHYYRDAQLRRLY